MTCNDIFLVVHYGGIQFHELDPRHVVLTDVDACPWISWFCMQWVVTSSNALHHGVSGRAQSIAVCLPMHGIFVFPIWGLWHDVSKSLVWWVFTAHIIATDPGACCWAQENGLEDQFVLPLTRRFNQIWRLMVFVAGSQLHLVWLLLILVCLHLASPFMSKVVYPSSCSFFQRHQSERHSEGRVGDRMSPFRLEWGYDL